MAKWGEGDARWKVDELGSTGRNVNSWHWEEHNALPWVKDRLSQLFKDLVLVDQDDISIKTAAAPTVDGEAVINQRKGKLIPAYELNISIKWKGSDASGEQNTYNGDMKLPYVSEENHDEDPEVQVTVKESGEGAEKMRSMIVNKGREKVWEKIRLFLNELQSGGPMAGKTANGNGSAPAADASLDEFTKPLEASKSSGTNRDSKATSQSMPTTQMSGKSIELTETFFASPKDLYECFTDPTRIRAYTASPCIIEPTPGGKLSMFNGSVEGSFRVLEPCTRLDLDWRFSNWPEGVFSRVNIEFIEEERGKTLLKLQQSGIPEEDKYGNHDVVTTTKIGWKGQVLERIRKVFGFGA